MKRKLFKRAGAVTLAALMLTGAGLTLPEVLSTSLTVSAAGETETPASCFTYTEDYEGNLTITKFTGTQEVVVVPATIDGMDVKVIDGWTFEGCTGVKRVVLPEGLETIAASAFANCTNLQTVSIPSTVTEVGNSAFYLCKNLQQVTLPDSVTYLGNSAFNGCQSLESVTLSASLGCIHKTVFKNCSSLKTIVVPSKVTLIEEQAFVSSGLESISLSSGLSEIAKNAFQNCSKLTEINIPVTVGLIDNKAFQGCSSLKAINMVRDNFAYASVDGVLLSADKKNLILCPEGKEGSYTVPSSVMSTDYNAFMNCTKLTSVTLSSLMDGIYYNVFYGCTGLTNFEVPENITSIGSYAFGACTGLRTITIPESVTDINDYAFSGCSELTIIGKKGSTAETFANEHGFTFSVILPKLVNNTTLSASAIRVGESVKVNCGAAGGDSSYQYEVAYKEKLASSWTTVQSYHANAAVNITPGAAGNYSVRVTVRDGRGTLASGVYDLTVKEALKNLSTVSASAAKTGTSVTLNGAASDSGAIQYAYYYCAPGTTNWVTLQDYSNKTSATLYLAKTGTYRVRVDVKEGSGPALEKVMEVTAYDTLKVTASVSASTLKTGGSVTVQGSASGGYGTKQYQFSVKKPNSNTWTVIRAYAAGSSLTYKPTELGTHTLRVEVKDELNKTAKQELTLEVFAPMVLSASVSETAHLVNTGLTVSFSSTGGLGTKQYAVWYKKTDSQKWLTAMSYSDKTQVVVTPRNTGTYTVRVGVKDERGKVIYQNLTVTVISPLKNTSTVSDTAIKKGSSITVAASSTGGLGTRQYAVWYKKTDSQKWLTATNYSDKTEIVVTPRNTGTYTLRVGVKDERGRVIKKDLTVRVFTSLKNTSTISAAEIKYGSSITVSASSTGGLGVKEYAIWYRNTNNQKWTQAQDYSENTTVSIKPKQTGEYYVRIRVKDERDVIVRKTLTLTVNK